MFISLCKIKGTSQSWFSIHDQQASLLDLFCLTAVSWQDGRLVHEKQYSFDTQAEKDAQIRQLFKDKIAAGYKVLYAFPADQEQKYCLNSFGQVVSH